MSAQQDPQSHFDSPERSSESAIADMNFFLRKQEIIQDVLEGIPDLALILDMNRQIVAYNRKAYETFSALRETDILGKRPGEAIRCVHRADMPAGCGTSEFCQECGAGKALKHTHETLQKAIEECRIISEYDGNEIAFDFNVHTKLLRIGDKEFLFFAIEDISHEKRREALERIFFHDVLNTSGAVHGLASILQHIESAERRKELTESLLNSAEQLVREIQAQRQLRYAEDGKLEINNDVVGVNTILKSIRDLYKNHRLTRGKRLEFDYPDPEIFIHTDMSILTRCIGNFTKNALEASEEGDTVHIYSEVNNNDITLHIKSETIIPQMIQRQIFQRSFSTKADKGRGIGTYSVKLLIEQYLKGKVSFLSTEETRTVFSITLFSVVDEQPGSKSKSSTFSHYGKLSGSKDKNKEADSEDPITPPPKEVLEEIKSLASMGDISQLKSRFSEMKKEHPEASAFFDMLMYYVDRYQVSAIENVLKEYLD